MSYCSVFVEAPTKPVLFTVCSLHIKDALRLGQTGPNHCFFWFYSFRKPTLLGEHLGGLDEATKFLKGTEG